MVAEEAVCVNTGEPCAWRQAAIDVRDDLEPGFLARMFFSKGPANKLCLLNLALVRNCVAPCIVMDCITSPDFREVSELVVQKKEGRKFVGPVDYAETNQGLRKI
jgi:hypothetical protein